jgi:putative MATE family efflux protein
MDQADTAAKPLADRRLPMWRTVLALSLPVLAQQLLILSVGLSDRFLAGFFEPQSPHERAEMIGCHVLALGQLGTPGPGGGVASVLAAEAAWEHARQFTARHAAYQSAQTTANYLAWFINSYTVLVSVGSTALVARFVGAGDRAAAIRVTNQSILLAVVLGLIGTVAGFLGMRQLIAVLQLSGPSADIAVAYLRPIFALLVFQVIEVAGIACLIGAGDTRTGFWVLGGVAVINLPLAWSFFLGIGPWPGLGFEGIAVGTAVSHTIGGSAVLILLARGRAGLHLRLPLLRPNGNLIWRILRISVPAGADSLSVIVGQFWFLSLVNRLGDVAGSAHGIALGWEAMGFLSGAAFGTAAMTLVGQNLGAGKPERAAHSGWVAFGVGGVVMCAMGAIFFTLARPMFTLFCPHPDQVAIVDTGVPVLRLSALFMPGLACCIIFTYALRGAGDTRVPLLFTWIGFLGIRIPLTYVLALESVDLGSLGTWHGAALGLYGAWLAMFADIVIRGGFFLYRFTSGRWQRIQV